MLRFETLEDRRMLSAGSYPELPGTVLVNPMENQFDSQIIYLDFDGAEDVTYNGSVVVKDIDVPAFKAPGDLREQEQEIIAGTITQLEETFAGSGIVFTTVQPTVGIDYSTMYVGGDDVAFGQYGVPHVSLSNAPLCPRCFPPKQESDCRFKLSLRFTSRMIAGFLKVFDSTKRWNSKL